MEALDTIISAEKTRGRELVALWESGGMDSGYGEATIVARSNGQKPSAVCFKKTPNGNHAMIPIFRNDIIVKTFFDDASTSHFSHTIYWVSRAYTEKNGEAKVCMKRINQFENGRWENPLAEHLKPVVFVAELKAKKERCCRAMYVKNMKKK